MDEFDPSRFEVKQYLQSLNEFKHEQEGLLIVAKKNQQILKEHDLINLNQLLTKLDSIKLVLPQDYARADIQENKLVFKPWVEKGMVHSDVYQSLFGDTYKFLSPLSTDRTLLRLPIWLNDTFSLSDFNQLRSSLAEFDEYSFHFLGIEILRHYLSLETLKYLFFVGPILCIVLIFVLYLYYRSFVPILYTLLTLIYSMLVTFGCSIYLYGGFSPFVSIGILFVFVIGTSDLIHIFSDPTFSKDINAQSINHVFKQKFKVCFLTSFTTVIAFASFLFSEMKVLRMLGLSCFVGLISCFLFTFYYLPGLMNWLNSRFDQFKSTTWTTHLFKLNLGINKKILYWVFLLPAFLSLFFIGKFNFNFHQSPLKVFSKNHEYTRGLQLYYDHFSENTRSSVLVLRGPETEVVKSYLKGDQRIHSILDGDDVFNILTQHHSPDIKSKIQSALSGYTLPSEHLYQNEKFNRIMFFSSANDLEDVLDDLDKFLVSHQLHETSILQSYEKVRNSFFQLLGQNLFLSLLWTFLLIFATIQVVYRNIKISLIAIFVNITPCLMTIVFAKLMGIEFNMNLVISLSLLLGLGVDDTIHYLESFTRKRVENLATMHAIQLTSYVLILLFSLLSISNVIIFQEIAWVLSFGLAMALLYDCFMLPILLRRYVTPSLTSNNSI
jgi:predicted RND superfamily exporter protein